MSDNLRNGPIVGGFFSNSYGFTSGFLNASFGDASPSSQICETNITRFLGFSGKFVDQFMEGTTDSLEASVFSFENILASVHPIAFGCYSSVFEFSETSDYYMETFSDFSKVTYNLIHKLGNIYDTIFYLIKHQQKKEELDKATEAEVSDWWFKLGIYYGTLSFLIFYSPMDVDPFDPLDEYTGLENGDHLFTQ